ncbi:hypothetical protein FJ946_29985 [Mesorhizobium sp. B2-4-7]|nr:hypothetical protein FJW11_27975 [Mesorhizobium sp. B3-1-1]TPJ46039.1 hypothetical protein FJ437_15260 [Mesorhizobium sp. B2-6-6]TPJ58248.1 hypothetical protein FJ443_26965 [Mesorhizobium sp. B2-6-1]TPJ66323.1 hypothetical protein FJ462_17400 [Mesorhizobium sp. B2-6-7]TPJ81805.1 hypothetical protein FJ422_20910 [Mesorhizobium sp. B2-6-3]TPJ94883.1 hypothetical protein FJ489_17910 [Mesorhizobium sp. B2-5-12]TPJ97817.1 hypothetical protein FJ491_18255 [Mesorhizobium sp. B2-5-10]TPK06110.1 h
MLYPGRFLGPSDIVMLAHVCHSVCKERGVAPASNEAARIAAHVLRLFMNGLTEEDELLDAERNWARRLDPSYLQNPVNYAETEEAA